MESFVSALDRERFSPAVFSFAHGPREERLRAQGIPTYVGADLFDCLNRFKPHIVHVHRAGWPEPGLLRPIRLARGPDFLPAVVETNVFGRRDASPSAALVDRHLFVSHFCAERYARTNGVLVEKPLYRTLYNPVNTDYFAEHAGKSDFSKPVMGRLSRPDPGKWSSLALEIIPLLAKRVPAFSYHIVGAVPHARDFVREHGLSAHVSFLDPVLSDEELAQFFNGVSLLAHANDTGESFGLAIAEAMAAGLPVVTHPCPGLKDNAQLELVEHGKTGLVAESAEEYADAAAWLMTHPDEAKAMGRAGRDKATRLYRVQTLARELEAIYEEVLAERMGRSDSQANE
jgi:glycosyltransferase involved in cell wall biosynthesis